MEYLNLFLEGLAQGVVPYVIFLMLLPYFALLCATLRVIRFNATPAAIDAFAASLPKPLRWIMDFVAPRSDTLASYLKRTTGARHIVMFGLTLIGLLCFGSLILGIAWQFLLSMVLVESPAAKAASLVYIIAGGYQLARALRFGYSIRSLDRNFAPKLTTRKSS